MPRLHASTAISSSGKATLAQTTTPPPPNTTAAQPPSPQLPGMRRLNDTGTFQAQTRAPASRRLLKRIPYVLDLNVDYANYSEPSLKMLYQSGARSLLVVSQMNGTDCPLASLLVFSRKLGYHATSVEIDPKNGIMGMAGKLTQMGAGNSLDVFLSCTSKHEVVALAMMGCYMIGLVPGLFLSHVPGTIRQLEPVLEHWAISYLLESRPFEFLAQGILTPLEWTREKTPHGMVSTHYEAFEFALGDIFPTHQVTMMTVQILSCGAVLSSAMWGRQSTYKFRKGAQTVAEYIFNFVHMSNVSTFDGVKQFDLQGRCSTCTAGAQQVFPFSTPRGADNHTHWFARYANGDTKIVKPSHGDLRTVPSQWFRFFGDVQARMPSWRDKLRSVYPCLEGCFMQETSIGCEACPAGHFRAHDDLNCRRCPSGRYQDEEGLASCKACPKGADCRNATNTTPIAKPGWFRVDTAPAAAASAKTNYSAGVCAGTGRISAERFRWVPCPEAQICLGANRCSQGNTGVLCASCDYGSSFMGFYPNLRKCGECPSGTILGLRVVLVYVLFFGVLFALQHVAFHEASDAKSLVIPVCVILLRHMQVLGMIAHSVALDRSSSFFAHVPGIFSSFSVQPFLVAQLDCRRQGQGDSVTDHLVSSIEMFMWGACLLPVGYVAILLFHLARWLMGSFRIKFHLRVKASSSKAEKAILFAKRMALSRLSVHRLYDLPRQLIGWALIAVPVATHSCSQLLACAPQAGSDVVILRMNSNVICTSQEYKDLVPNIMTIFFVVTIPHILALYYLLVGASRHQIHRHISGRRTLGLLIVGWRDTNMHFELVYFMRSMWISGCPTLFEGRDKVFAGQLAGLLVTALLARINMPRMNNDRRALLQLEQQSWVLLACTLGLGYVYEIVRERDTDDGILKADMVPLFIANKQVACTNGMALAHIFFIGALVFTLVWNKVIIGMQVRQTCYRNVEGCRSVLLYFARCLRGLSHIKFRTEDAHGAYMDVGDLKEGERKLLMLGFRMLIQVCLDSNNKFNMKFIMGAVQEVFSRAGVTRYAEMQAYETRCLMKGKTLQRIHISSNSLMNKSTITIDEFQAAFADVEQDIINRTPDLHAVNAVLGAVRQGHIRREVDAEDMREHRGIGWKKNDEQKLQTLGDLQPDGSSTNPQVTTLGVLSNLDHMFQDDVELISDHQKELLIQNRLYQLKLRNGEAQSEIHRLWERLNRTHMSRDVSLWVENMETKADHALEMTRVLGQKDPLIPSDVQTLHGAWKLRRDPYTTPQPSSLYSPRARGLEPTAQVPRSFWHGIDNDSAPSQRSPQQSELDNPSRGFGAPRQETAPAAAAEAPLAAAASTEQQEALQFHFGVPFKKVHHGVFKAMLLSGFRASGVPEASVLKLTIALLQDAQNVRTEESTIVAHVQGPRMQIGELRQREEIARLKVMGHPVRSVENALLLQGSEEVAVASLVTVAGAAETDM